ncbi:helix-turn-helix domain-containing protein [Kutzneria viridogrisea]|uniref:DNA-binding HxlR family transcriptional regulator n=1 Tax=Kutzneria viridogrisea TaxID=47990 RepID=A0ABR6BDI0_9PSEU|nr:DNA-binding HxlR family transcriptional regulator [Kutzneria viridogrisea]
MSRLTTQAPTVLRAGGPNAVGVMLGLLGDEWTLLILREALLGARRFVDWRARLPISNAVLTARLNRLAGAGLLDRHAYQDRPPRWEYRLTERGAGVWPVLLCIWAWEATWVPEHVERLPVRVHAACGQAFDPVLVCAACEQPVTAAPDQLTGGFGPSGGWARSVPDASTRRRSVGGDAGLFPQTTALMGNRWSAALLGAAFLGVHRFAEFQRCLAAPPTVVADRIRRFCELGVLRERDYRLTAKGRAFLPVVLTAVDWAQRWFHAEEGPALEHVHTACGASFSPALSCSACAGRLCRVDVRVRTDTVTMLDPASRSRR